MTEPLARVTGDASHQASIKEVLIDVWNQTIERLPHKVFYQPGAKDETQLPFTAEVPLQLGNNVIRVVARAGSGEQATRWLSILCVKK